MIVEVGDRNVTILQTSHILWAGKVLIFIAQVAEPVQELALAVKYTNAVGL